MQERLKFMNVSDSKLKSPDEFAAVVANDLKVWKKIVTDANISTGN